MAALAKRWSGNSLTLAPGAAWGVPLLFPWARLRIRTPNNDEACARPEYDPPEPTYHRARPRPDQYLESARADPELLTHYGPIAAIWLDGIAVPLSRRPGSILCPS
jgi:hypothetical protein